jgi:HK97 family phage prohead protease
MITSLPIEVQLSADRGKRELTYYASQIGNRDFQGMRCMPGCFAQTINTRLPQGLIKLARNHQDKNTGVIKHAEEDSFGLLNVAYVSKTRDGDELLEQVLDGSLTHCSFRGSVIRGAWVIDGEDDDKRPIETLNLLEIKLKETGPVDFDPANMGATILAVKSLGAEIMDEVRELPLLVKSVVLGRGRDLTSEERRVVKFLIELRKSLDEHGGVLEAMLAPGSATPPPKAAPDRPTQEAVEKADLARMEQVMDLILRRRNLFQP